jgi:hypothetical protein
MTTTRNLAPLLATILAIGSSAAASASAAETVTCPATFPMQSLRYATTADGWKPEPGERPAPLVGWGLFSGPPAELASLQETTEHKGQAIWQLAPPYPGGLWVQCVYAGGALTLTRRLSLTTGVCVAPGEVPPSSKPKAISFVCR